MLLAANEVDLRCQSLLLLSSLNDHDYTGQVYISHATREKINAGTFQIFFFSSVSMIMTGQLYDPLCDCQIP